MNEEKNETLKDEINELIENKMVDIVNKLSKKKKKKILGKLK